ncbi:GyrI-like domain-containing protein [Christensenella tenuis]|uniref:GyrI-like domain-containing protein n=1 Tax=Christensenella tenuis TaxID=2763033 RepID=A0ABR7EEW1_9FIRM|nr:GyrI-like domain-containing protein [Christensenella tenuis]MBC5648317.1 GyrI-like domain-containing protein [Christensenella tenuis]
MADKLDYKKEYKDLYLPKAKPMLVEVPPIHFIMVDGKGAPEDVEYQNAVRALYALSFTIKMSKMGGMQPEGYFEYVVPPLEGLWYGDKGRFETDRRGEWMWISMIRQPEFVTPDVFGWAMEECRRKKPDVDISGARFETFEEGLCAQMMHVGPYSKEAETVEALHRYIEENGLKDMTGTKRKHHEIYLGDPRRTAPKRLRTVLRLPVERKEA